MPSEFSQYVCDAKKIELLPDLEVGASHPDFGEVQNYLRRYGYLTSDQPCKPGELCADTSRVLKGFQEFFGLEPLGSFDGATRTAMAAPRCGLPDFSELDANTIGPWNDGNLTYAFGNSTGQAVGDQAARAAVRNAFATWSAASGQVDFSEVGSQDSPNVLVEWRPANDPDHSMVGGVLAHADFPPGFSIIGQGQTLPLHFDDDEHTWVVGTVPGAFDIETVALHEIGHCLGILHSSVRGAVMFPSVRNNFIRHDPQPDDLLAIRELYGNGNA